MIYVILAAIETVAFAGGFFVLFTALAGSWCGLLMGVGAAAFGLMECTKQFFNYRMAKGMLNSICGDDDDDFDDEPM